MYEQCIDSVLAMRRGTATVGRSATMTVEAVKTQQFTSFEDMVRTSDVPVLVDFHAQWCGPCKLMGDALKVCSTPSSWHVCCVPLVKPLLK